MNQLAGRKDGRHGPVDHAWADEANNRRLTGALEEADRLADSGQYGEAIHALLLHSLEELGRGFNVTLSASLTSREVLTILAVTEDAKAALAQIVTIAELDYFGGRESGEAEYQTVRVSYLRLTTPGGGAV